MPTVYFAIVALEVVAILVVLTMYVLEHHRDKRLFDNKEKPMLDQLKSKNEQVLQHAITESQEIISGAETESLKVVADSRLKIKELEDHFDEQLKLLNEGLGKKYEEQSKLALDGFNDYLKTLGTKTDATQASIENLTKARVNEFIEKFEQNLSDFLVSSQQKSLSAIELELTSARNLIETYKEKQIKIINDNILAMLEQTLSLVLARKLTLKDHIDLIYESLEKAKAEKFIG